MGIPEQGNELDYGVYRYCSVAGGEGDVIVAGVQ